MPVLKVKKDNGVWQDIATANSHAHTMKDITDLPASLVDDVEALKDKVGADSVAYQVSTAVQASAYQHPYTHPADMITGLADVAISGSYEDLTDKPIIPEEYVHPETHPVSMIEGLATVATSGDYNDLNNKPVIPSIDGLATKTYVDEQIASVGSTGGTVEQVQADWDETDTTSPAYIKNKPNISGGSSGGNCSCPTGTIENTITIEWNTSNPTATFDIATLGYTAYKISNSTPTKEQLLMSNWSLYNGTDTYDLTISEADIMMESDTSVILNLTSSPYFGYIICYEAGETTLNYSGTDITLVIPETGIYQIWSPNDTLPTDYVGFITCTYTEEVNFVQPDWNQNDSTQPDYIKNRPFYDGGAIFTKIFPETTIPFNFESDMGMYMFATQADSEMLNTWYGDWTEMQVVWDGDTYVCQAQNVEGIKAIGNVPLMMGTGDSGEPFIMIVANAAQFGQDICMIYSLNDDIPEDPSTAETKYHTISLSCEVQQITKVPTKFLYQPDWFEINKDSGSYIKNKPFGYYPAGTVLFDGELSLYMAEDSQYLYVGTPNINVIPADGSSLSLTIDDTTYSSTVSVSSDGAQANSTFSLGDGSQIQFMITNGMIVVFTTFSEAPTIVVKLESDVYAKIPEEYLPDSIGSGSSLPEVTTSNNNQVLTVVNGVWTAQTPASGLPSVTTSDNDKVLKVVSGSWIASEAPNGLPDVTTDDNDKVLKVVDGAWSVASNLPSVTTDDVGKFLRVSADGLWIAESVPNAEEASF